MDQGTNAIATENDRPHRRCRPTVIVVRHGERLDYVMRAAGNNWCRDNPEQPWNPPLTENGARMAEELGATLQHNILAGLDLPPIGAVYTSPFLRCRQTAAGIVRGMKNSVNATRDDSIKVRVEMGLSESINENWYRSWSLPGTDGTWGFQKEITMAEFRDTMDRRALQPVETLLEWREDRIVDDDVMDYDHQSITSIGGNYSYKEFPPKLESFRIQRARMEHTMNTLSSTTTSNDGETGTTIVLVSHGGPVTHLYESLTGNRWDEHGVAKYCSFSIYQNNQEELSADDVESINKWTPLVVNRVLWQDNATEDDSSNNNPSR